MEGNPTMLTRQKALLHFLTLASRPVSKIELTKWAFILRSEMASGGGSAFYDFVPYKYGPFSFCLYREVDALIRDGYVREAEHWRSTRIASEATNSLPLVVQEDVQAVVSRFAPQQLNKLVEYVYTKHPRFTVNSERKQLAKRKVAPPAIYTAGYEKLSIDAFLDRLICSGIQRIIDVRNNPIARRYGFHKSTLRSLANRLAIEYVHFPELGIRSALRRHLSSPQDYNTLFRDYERTTLDQQSDSIQRVEGLVREKASVLLCMEADPVSCHRNRLAVRLAERTRLPVQDLGSSHK